MQFTIDAAVLTRVLQSSKAGYFSASAYVQIQARANAVTLTTSDEELRLAVRIAETVCIAEEGEFALPYQQLFRVVESLQGRINLCRDGSAIIVSAEGERPRQTPLLGYEVSQIPVFSPLIRVGETYTKTELAQKRCPSCGHTSFSQTTSTYQIMEGTHIQRVSLARAALNAMCKHVAWAAQEVDDQRPALNGILIEVVNNCFELIAGNAHCLVMCRRTIEGAGNWSQSVLVNAKLLKRAIRILPKESIVLVEAFLTERRQIRFGDQNLADVVPFQHATAIRLTAGNVEVMLALMSETYPDYQPVLQQRYETRAVLATADLLTLIKSIAPIAEEHHNTLRLSLGASLQAKAGYEPHVAVHEVAVEQKSGADQEVLLQPSYLLRALHATQLPHLVLEVAEASLLKAGAPEPGKVVIMCAEDGQESYLCAIACQKDPTPPQVQEASDETSAQPFEELRVEDLLSIGQPLVEVKVGEPASPEPEKAGNAAEQVLFDALPGMNAQAGGHVAHGQTLRVPPPVTPLMTLDPFQNAYHGQVEIQMGKKRRPKTESGVIGAIREVYEAERDQVGESEVKDPAYWLKKVNWMSVYLLEDLGKFTEVAWILGDYDPVSSGVLAGIKATPEQIAGYLMAGVDDKEWAIRVMKMHLRTPEQQAWLASKDYSLEDVLNGGTSSEPEIQAMFDDWNAKLGVKAFGF